MAKITAQRGTMDITPKDIYKWQYIEKTARDVAARYGFSEIRVPTFEATELFSRGVGDTTDVVQKEMYTFEDKGGRSITLRPEGTAGIARAMIENSLYGDALPLKLYYILNCFRYEKPQAGRTREFTQFGVELFGSENPMADAQVIALVNTLLNELSIKNITLELNSIGCKNCRPKFNEALIKYFSQYKDKLCPTCLSRLEKNPLRILDCKSEVCKEIAKNAPTGLEFICEDCKTHFESVKNALTAMNIDYVINPKIVRGLDYYTKTVFEFVSNNIGAQGTVCGGGRYDGLVEDLGGPKMCGIGFGLGISRLIMLMENTGVEFPLPEKCSLYIGSMGEKASLKAMEIAKNLRAEGYYVEEDIMGRGVKAQMKYANKIGASYSVIIGDNELSEDKAMIKDMETGEQKEIKLSDICGEFTKIILEKHQNSILDTNF